MLRLQPPEPALAGDADVIATAPASFAQQQLWLMAQMYPDSCAYHVKTGYRIRGALNVPLLRSSLAELVRRHEALRTTFISVDGDVRQVINPPGELAMTVVHVAASSATARERAAQQRLAANGMQPFDLVRGPLVRVELLCFAPDEHALLLVMHHIVFDDGSLPAFNRELRAIYAAGLHGTPHGLDELPIQYADFAMWQRESMLTFEMQAQLAYWRTQLADVPPRVELPLDRPRHAVARFNGAVRAIVWGPELAQRIRAHSRANGTTLFMTMLAALDVVLYRYTGQTDLVIACPLGGRTRTELEPLIGYFVNPVALRTRLRAEDTFGDVLQAVRETTIAGIENGDVPFEHVIAQVAPERSLSGTPIVNVLFFVRSDLGAPLELEGVDVERLPFTSAHAKFDLNLRLTERADGIACSFQYDTDIFDGATIDGLLAHLTQLVDYVTSARAAADVPIARIPLLDAAERKALVVDANQTQAAFPADKTIIDLIAATARRTPQAVALVCAGTQLTYAQLDAAAERLAAGLGRRGVPRGTRVGVLLERSPALLIALLGVLKYGCAYVPLDPLYPAERLAFIAADAGLATILSHPARSAGLLQAALTSLDLDALLNDETVERPADTAANRAGAAAPDDLAYTIYTSGSTGRPKGVDITHRSLVNVLWSMRTAPGVDSNDTFLAVTTVSFDIAALELFLPLIVGATVAIATADQVADGTALGSLLTQTRATVMQATPLSWQLLIEAGWRGGALRLALCGGEALSRRLADALLDRVPAVWNMYGPTETTIWSAATRVTRGDGPVLFGPPIANTQFYVLDAQGELAPTGVPGELAIGGEGVARGYHARPDLDQARFRTDRFGLDRSRRLYLTGDIVRARGAQYEFLGRADHQVKVRGFRVELGEIAAALSAQPGVADAVAIVVRDATDTAVIRAYVTPQSPFDLDAQWPATLRTAIARFLPGYMVPATIRVRDRLPRTPAGKIDRDALAREERSAIAEPLPEVVSRTQARLHQVVAALLGHPDFGVHDDLFARGLHSLAAVRLVQALPAAFAIELPLRAVFEHPTIAGLAKRIEAATRSVATAEVAAGPIVTLEAGPDALPVFFFHGDTLYEGGYCRRLAAAIAPALTLHAVAPHGTAGLPQLRSVEAMAVDYIARIKRLQPNGPYRIAGFCMGGVIGYEVARRLAASGDAVDEVIIVNSYPQPPAKIPGSDAFVRWIGLNERLSTRLRHLACYNINAVWLALDSGPAACRRFLRLRLARVWKMLGCTAGATLEAPAAAAGATQRNWENEAPLAHRVARMTFHPQPYAGDVTLVWSVAPSEMPSGDPLRDDPTVRWGAVSPNISVRSMTGNHDSPIHERLDDLARIFLELYCDGARTPTPLPTVAGV